MREYEAQAAADLRSVRSGPHSRAVTTGITTPHQGEDLLFRVIDSFRGASAVPSVPSRASTPASVWQPLRSAPAGVIQECGPRK